MDIMSSNHRRSQGLEEHYLGTEHPQKNHVDRRENDEEKVISPTNGGEPGRGGLEEGQCRQEED
jgi:hypothetical protein